MIQHIPLVESELHPQNEHGLYMTKGMNLLKRDRSKKPDEERHFAVMNLQEPLSKRLRRTANLLIKALPNPADPTSYSKHSKSQRPSQRQKASQGM